VASLTPKKLKAKKCRACGEKFVPWTSLAKACSPQCAIELTRDQERKRQKKEIRQARERLKTKSDYLKETQGACNAYIRERDKDKPCISCGRYDHEIPERYTGGKWDAGHYKSRGAFPELRFHPANIHKQCKSCNGGSGKYTRKNKTVSQDYENNVFYRIGERMLNWLNGPQEAQHWTIDDLKEIKQYYKDQLKALKI
jgi:hypothetical protein